MELRSCFYLDMDALRQVLSIADHPPTRKESDRDAAAPQFFTVLGATSFPKKNIAANRASRRPPTMLVWAAFESLISASPDCFEHKSSAPE
jgi:hypothetical protein